MQTQAEAHQKAVDEFRKTQQQPKPETQSLIQTLGGAAVLALLGNLGLQRLQNIDAGIHNVRESVFAQAGAHEQFALSGNHQ